MFPLTSVFRSVNVKLRLAVTEDESVVCVTSAMQLLLTLSIKFEAGVSSQYYTCAIASQEHEI